MHESDAPYEIETTDEKGEALVIRFLSGRESLQRIVNALAAVDRQFSKSICKKQVLNS